MGNLSFSNTGYGQNTAEAYHSLVSNLQHNYPYSLELDQSRHTIQIDTYGTYQVYYSLCTAAESDRNAIQAYLYTGKELPGPSRKYVLYSTPGSETLSHVLEKFSVSIEDVLVEEEYRNNLDKLLPQYTVIHVVAERVHIR